MDLSNSRYLENDVIELLFVDAADATQAWKMNETLDLMFDNGDFFIRQSEAFAAVEITHKKLVAKVFQATVCLVACFINESRLWVRVLDVVAQFNENIPLTFDSHAVTQIAKAGQLTPEFAQVEQWFEEQFFFDYRQQSGLLLVFANEQAQGSFTIAGAKYSAHVTQLQKRWFVNQVVPLRIRPEHMRLFYGDHQLKHQTNAQKLEDDGYQLQLEQQVNSNGSYFNLWRLYSEVQWRQVLRLAKTAKALKYSRCEVVDDEISIRWRFVIGQTKARTFIDTCKAELEKQGERFDLHSLELQVDEDLPKELIDNLENEFQPVKTTGQKPNVLRKVHFENGTLVADLDRLPPAKGVIFIGLHGFKKQHERKKNAFDLLRVGDNPLPQLQYILEGITPAKMRGNKTKAFSSSTLAKFKGTPTERQRRALQVALDTADIALVIGPPGTGKTQVITALQQRVAELGRVAGAPLTHQTLLTSYQHDAVENVVARSGVFGLPAIKIGKRAKAPNISHNPQLGRWRDARLANLEGPLAAQLEQYPVYHQIKAVEALALQVRLARSPMAIKYYLRQLDMAIEQIAEKHAIILEQHLADDYLTKFNRFRALQTVDITDDERLYLQRLCHGLRTTKVAFNDDGLLRAQTLFQRLQYCPTFADKAQLLGQLIDRSAQLNDWVAFKQGLIDALLPPYLLADERYLKSDETALLDSLVGAFYKAILQSSVLGKLFHRQQYVEALKQNPDWVVRSIKEYVNVLGATCQQAAGDQMLGLKSVQSSKELQFDTVVVDEAARANPLDLMIPMAMATRRVVLVGDHLQLPHMLEPKVEKELQEIDEVDQTRRLWLQQSLFERLYQDLKKIQDNGGGQRVVMLNKQFRMHPVLGDFYSREFYESKGFGKVSSGRPTSDFPLDVPGFEGCVAAWVDVDKARGKMESHRGSKYRQCEAAEVAERAEAILRARADLSVGIITFYAAQRDKIIEQLIERNVMSKSGDQYMPKEQFKLTESNEERLQVGSVDAFQGKEFDVVLLSTVRHWSAPDVVSEDTVNAKLGFLRIPNRINVAMTRQRRLLIVVGDKSLATQMLGQQYEFSADNKQQLLPGLPAFYHQLCCGEFGCVL